jgi:cation-transporting ATPase 13A1
MKDNLDVDGAHKNVILFNGTNVLEASPMGTFDTHCVFLFIGSLLIFVITASWYVWVRDISCVWSRINHE